MRILVALAILTLGSGLALSGQDEPPRAAHELASALEQDMAEIVELSERYRAADGEQRLVIDAQLVRKSQAVLARLVSLGEAIEQAERDGDDVSVPLGIAEDALVTAMEITKGDVAAAMDRVDLLRRERAQLPGDELLPVERRLTAADAELDELLVWVQRIADLKERLAVDVEEDQEYFDELLNERAVALRAQVEVTLNRQRAVQARLDGADATDEAVLRAELRAVRERLHGSTESLNANVDLMDARGLDTSSYKQLLIQSTGNISTDILDADVLIGLIRQTWSSFVNWISVSAPQFAFNLVLFLVILLTFKVLARFASRVVERGISAADSKVPVLMRNMTVSIVSKAVLFVGFLIGLSQLGFEIGPLLAGLGVLGFIVGFALQDSLSNFAAGVMILFYRPFDVGDSIEAGGISGKVDNMNVVSTTMLTSDNQTLIVPNNKIWGGVIRNQSARETRRVDLSFTIGNDEDTERVERLLHDIVSSHPAVLDSPAPLVKVNALGAASFEIIVRPWTKSADYGRVYWDVTRAVRDRFKSDDIAGAHPRYDVMVLGNNAGESISR